MFWSFYDLVVNSCWWPCCELADVYIADVWWTMEILSPWVDRVWTDVADGGQTSSQHGYYLRCVWQRLSSKQDTLRQCWFAAGPPSGVCWVAGVENKPSVFVFPSYMGFNCGLPTDHWLKANPRKKTTRWPKAGWMLARRLRRRPNIHPALGQCIVFAGISLSGSY